MKTHLSAIASNVADIHETTKGISSEGILSSGVSCFLIESRQLLFEPLRIWWICATSDDTRYHATKHSSQELETKRIGNHDAITLLDAFGLEKLSNRTRLLPQLLVCQGIRNVTLLVDPTKELMVRLLGNMASEH